MIDQKVIDSIVNEIYNRLKQREQQQVLLLIGQTMREDEQILKENYCLTSDPMENVDYAAILINELSQEQLAHLVTGCSTTNEERCILKTLLQGKTVYLLEKGLLYRRYRDTAHKPLYTLYQDYENKLRQYGVQIISHVSEIFHSQKNEPCLVSTKEISLKHKKLLLETDFMNLSLEPYSIIEVSKRCIVTPLAEDYIKSHKLKIKRI